MKNRILKLMTLSMAIFMVACQESDNAIDKVFEGTTNGAIIRTVSLNSGEFNSYRERWSYGESKCIFTIQRK